MMRVRERDRERRDLMFVCLYEESSKYELQYICGGTAMVFSSGMRDN